ncbi:unnamed protein product [Miscanthus lutarioriparius]|uniref:TRAFD1/XAF1 zinc finger domain-containing protein n=1 Tax=Miscanthus lutarioriparius TaxID=422564 RepID=A0A811M5S0_9POAL|nr:unnamed protein product [Miscanthus lutarioriparius]
MAAAAADSDPAAAVAAMSTCAHCQREIPSSNIDLHSVHCARNLQKCQHCCEMIPRKLMDEHYDENHAPINCSLCKETIERESWDLHKGEKCPQRIVACEYCEFELPAVDLHEHQDVCGNRTELCQTCRKYIRLREWIGHETQCHTNSNGSADTSRAIPERVLRPPPPVRLARPARLAHASPHKRLLFTIAVTGIAVMIGSILFQRDEKAGVGLLFPPQAKIGCDM